MPASRLEPRSHDPARRVQARTRPPGRRCPRRCGRPAARTGEASGGQGPAPCRIASSVWSAVSLLPLFGPTAWASGSKLRALARSGFPLPFGRGEGQGEGLRENTLTGKAFPLTPTLSPTAGEREVRPPGFWFCRLSHGFRLLQSFESAASEQFPLRLRVFA